MKATSLKASQVLAVLRELPESNPDAIDGVREFTAAADKISELERAIAALRVAEARWFEAIAAAVRRAWKPEEITANARMMFGIPTAAAPGDRWWYNDGREGHVNIRGQVLQADERGASVQWEDRAEPTWIPWRDTAWWHSISIHRA